MSIGKEAGMFPGVFGEILIERPVLLNPAFKSLAVFAAIFSSR
jgi:hypothetical protein